MQNRLNSQFLFSISNFVIIESTYFQAIAHIQVTAVFRSSTNSLDKTESVQLEELPHKIIDEIFGEGWWDNDKDEEWQKLTLEQNALHQIDRPNTQLGQIELNSTDQNPPLTESDHFGQIELNLTDQNPPLTESDHFGQIELNSTDQNPPLTESDHFGQIELNLTDQNPPLTEFDHFGQIELNSTDQNPPLTESDHFGQIELNSTDQNPPLTESDHFGQIELNLTDQNPPLTESDHFGQIELNSTDQNPPLTESDHFGQIELNLTDQNPPLTESDHSDKTKNGEEQKEIIKEFTSTENIAKDERKRNIVDKFHAIKDAFKQKGKYSKKEWNQIEDRIGKHLKVNRKTVYKWKKEFGLSQKKTKNDRKKLVDKFDQKKAELTRDGFKNSYNHKIDETVAKDLGVSFRTIYNWKSKLGQTKPNHQNSQSEQNKLMKHYYEIKDQTPKISDEEIVKMLKIGTRRTLVNWKRQFKRQQFHQNSVDGHSAEENAAANVQQIENSNAGSV